MSIPLPRKRTGGYVALDNVAEHDHDMIVHDHHERECCSGKMVWRIIILALMLATLGMVLWSAIQSQRANDKLDDLTCAPTPPPPVTMTPPPV